MRFLLAAVFLFASLPALAQEAERALLGAETCPIALPEEGSWTEAEAWTWERLCRGQWVSLDRKDRATLPCNPAEIDGAVPPHRRLSAGFLHLILTHPRYVGALAKLRVYISCAVVDGELDLRHEHVVPAIGLFRSDIPSRVDLLDASLERSVVVNGSRLGSGLRAHHAKIGGNLFLSRGTVVKGDVGLRGASINGSIVAPGSVFEGGFDFDGADIGGGLFFGGGAEFKKELSLVSASIKANLDAGGSVFEGHFKADRAKVSGGIFLRYGATFQSIDLLGVKIGGSLQLGGGQFNGTINFTGLRIVNTLLVSSPKHGNPAWHNDARLILRNVSTDALQADIGAWRTESGDWLKTDLTGFVYGRLGGLNADIPSDGTNMADAPAEALIDWIEASQPDHDARFDPQPYTQLAEALVRAGAAEIANHVRYARFEHKRRAENTPFWTSASLFLGKWVIGYGVYPFRALLWLAGLVVIGVLVVGRSQAAALRGVVPRLWYSLENALPLVQLSEAHKNLDHGNAYVESFFHAQKLLGFVLVTILVGALSLLSG